MAPGAMQQEIAAWVRKCGSRDPYQDGAEQSFA
jgi:hypothetical protein